MRSQFVPELVNEPFGDPGLYVALKFERRALLFDLGDLARLSPRQLLKVSDVFVSHMHMDHFVGFDQLLRVCLGRDKHLRLFGPPGFIDAVAHKLAAYSWNLVRNYAADFALVVAEPAPAEALRRARFRCYTGFAPEPAEARPAPGGVLVDEPAFKVKAAVLDHGIPCLAFAVEESAHVNVWKNRLEEMGLSVGPWLRDLKAAVLRGEPDNAPIAVEWQNGAIGRPRTVPLGELSRTILRIAPGEKIAYVVDAGPAATNAARIVTLAQGADRLFIESPFLHRDVAIAERKRHLTARQAGELGRRAGVKHLVPFHFSPRYTGEEACLRGEAAAAFRAPANMGSGAAAADAV